MKDHATKINSYLTFKLGDEIFGANVAKVLNILEMTKITKVPKAPPYMKGVINLRGAVLPLIDTRVKFDMGETVYTTNTCILVLDIEVNGDSVHVGALVDSVQEVVEIDDSQIMPPPSIGSKYKSEFIEGMVKINDDFVMLLNMDLIFSTSELSLLRDSSEETVIEEES
ncbi:MAG: chemotaxis protein CheW [Bacteroidota bacterium]|jgi:Chemotaxis signal transduction protein|nr:chemotaxis protein CheW [Bacteroidota bacterium]